MGPLQDTYNSAHLHSSECQRLRAEPGSSWAVWHGQEPGFRIRVGWFPEQTVLVPQHTRPQASSGPEWGPLGMESASPGSSLGMQMTEVTPPGRGRNAGLLSRAGVTDAAGGLVTQFASLTTLAGVLQVRFRKAAFPCQTSAQTC